MARGYLPTRWRNMILPDGAMELIVNLGDPQKLCARDNPAKHTIFRQSWISGERTTPIVIDEIGYVHLVGVRLRAGGAWPFLGIPLREFTDQVVELETIMGREIEDLRDALCEARDDDSRFDLLESWLVRRARSRTQPTRSVSYVLAGNPRWIGPGADRQDCRHDWDQSQAFVPRIRSLCWIDAKVICPALRVSTCDSIRRTKGGSGLGGHGSNVRLPRSGAFDP